MEMLNTDIPQKPVDTGSGDAMERSALSQRPTSRYNFGKIAARLLQRSIRGFGTDGTPLLKFNVVGFEFWHFMSKSDRRSATRVIRGGVTEGLRAFENGTIFASLPLFRSYVASPGAMIRCFLGPWQDRNLTVNVHVKSTDVVVFVTFRTPTDGSDGDPMPPKTPSQCGRVFRINFGDLMVCGYSVSALWPRRPTLANSVTPELRFRTECVLRETYAGGYTLWEAKWPLLYRASTESDGHEATPTTKATCGRLTDQGWFDEEGELDFKLQSVVALGHPQHAEDGDGRTYWQRNVATVPVSCRLQLDTLAMVEREPADARVTCWIVGLTRDNSNVMNDVLYDGVHCVNHSHVTSIGHALYRETKTTFGITRPPTLH